MQTICKHTLKNIQDEIIPAILHANKISANMHYEICKGRIVRCTCNKRSKKTCKHALQNLRGTCNPLNIQLYMQYDMQACITKYARNVQSVVHAIREVKTCKHVLQDMQGTRICYYIDMCNTTCKQHAKMHYKVCKERIYHYT